MGCKAAVQALQKADFLKAKVTQKCDLLNDSQAWTNQQQLQTIYHQVLVLDLEYALDKKVEQELWTVGFKNHISTLQEQVRDKKNPHRSESQALLAWCLEAASGFYLTLLQELCMAFDLDLPFRKRLNIYSQTKSWNSTEQLNPPQASSCIYICQYCLVHLGDIARYRNQRKQAESFYKHAILLSPTSGQPYNQLALLQASQGDKLAAIFYYVRGIAVKNPFPATATNLANTLSLAIDKDDAITELQTKLTVNEFIRMFVRVHGLLYSATDLDQAEFGVKSLNSTLTPLVATHSFTEHKLIQITIINLYALKHTVGAGTLKTEELTEDEINVRKLVLDLLAGSLSAFLLPVYTLNQNSSLLEYYALPAIKLISYWLQNEPDILKETVFQNWLQIWPGLCKLLNGLQNHIKTFDYTNFTKTPLSEDRELQGFLPLVEAFKTLDFKLDELEENSETEKFIRAKRLIDFGIWLANFDFNNTKLIVAKINNEDQSTVFESGCVQPDPTTKLLEEMKSFNIVETMKTEKIKGPEKRGGILKPQGSLEKFRKEQETALKDNSNKSPLVANATNVTNKSESAKMKRVSQNVALQSIFKKMEENKQVKFDMGTVDKEKQLKVEVKPAPPKQQPPPTFPNLTYQSNPTFGQISKPLPTEMHQDYYKNFQNFANVPFERTLPNPQFSKNEMLPGSSDLNQMPHNMNFSLPPLQLQFNSPPPPLQNVNQPYSSNVQAQRSHMNQQIPLPYQNLPTLNQFPQSREFNAWKHEERPASNWWPNTNSPLPNTYAQRDFQVNYPFSNNMPYVNTGMEYNNQQTNQGSNMLNRPWSSTTTNLSPNHGMMGFDPSNQGLSLRQTMLKETRNLTMDNLSSNNETQEKVMQVPSTAQGYSLFNNSWSPSLPGQFRTNETSSDGLIQNLRQQSVFRDRLHYNNF
ncbi:hypothetical protein RN001_004637 [Aquatica leii]|uniref:Protein SMG7 n=1 Tax=Aquatica leii TaxID=1421715 RepID=A0AAN7PBW2_9COLE|nr:hypothetical protein RN001_004637 [Aquatica leii]